MRTLSEASYKFPAQRRVPVVRKRQKSHKLRHCTSWQLVDILGLHVSICRKIHSNLVPRHTILTACNPVWRHPFNDTIVWLRDDVMDEWGDA